MGILITHHFQFLLLLNNIKIIQFLIFCAICLSFSLSQAYSISGTVLDLESDNPIENVNVYIANSDIGTRTNDEGYFENDHPHGLGTETWIDGSQIAKGTYHYGVKEGDFIIKTIYGKYTGKFKAGLKEGHGIYEGEDNSKYVGEYFRGVAHGRGTDTTSTGDITTGTYHFGLLHGDNIIEEYADRQKIFDSILLNKLEGFYTDLGWTLKLNSYKEKFFI
mgnify:CR=1 FL=1